VIGTTLTQPGVHLDLTQPDAVRTLVLSQAPDAVIHTAYVKDGPAMDRVIIAGSEALAQACTEIGARLVHVSSDMVFSGNAGRPYVEDDQPDPLSAYGLAKAMAEHQVQAAAGDAALVRTSLLLGGRTRPGLHEMHAQRPGSKFWSNVVRCPLHVEDLAAALLELVDVAVSGPLHVAGPDAVSRTELAELVVGRPVTGCLAPEDVPLDVRLDSGRARDLLQTRLRGAREIFLASPTSG
jgi:dTDP-4-dehydrorhamnose reductase